MCKVRSYVYTCGHTVRFRLSSCRGTITQHKIQRPSRTRGTLKKTFSIEEMATIVKETRPIELKSRLLQRDPVRESAETHITRKPACVMVTDMVIHSDQKCGPCQFREFNDEHTQLLAEADERLMYARKVDQDAAEYIIGHEIPEELARLNVELLERARDKLVEQLDAEKWRIRERLAPEAKRGLGSLKMLDRVSDRSPLSHEVSSMEDDGEEEMELESEGEVRPLEILVLPDLNLIFAQW